MRKKGYSFIAMAALSLIALAGCRAPIGGIKESADASSRSLQDSSTDWNAARYGDILDIGTRIRHNDGNAISRAAQDAQVKARAAIAFAEGQEAEGETGDSGFTFDGGTKLFLGYDEGGYVFKEFTLRSIGQNVEVWIADDLSFPAGDGRPAHVIDQAQADSLSAEFDSVIHPKDTAFFGNPDSHSGSEALLAEWGYVEPGYYESADGIERTIILVDNVRDEQYYDPAYPFFIAGFYTGSFEAYFDRNVITIDSKDWATRLETTFFPTTAHEFQHLIHDDNDPMEETWVNEGMSDYAEYICGYGHPEGHINFFLDHPENSLVEWDDHYAAETGPETLADYGQAYLLQLYMSDQFGSAFTRSLAVSPLHGMESVEAALAAIGKDLSFAEIFRRFSLALVIDDNYPDKGIYRFKSIDLKVDFESAKAYDKDGVPAWGADYKVLPDPKKINGIKIDGIQYMPTPWKMTADPLDSGNSVYWGNQGNEIVNRMILPLDLSGLAAASLSFDTVYDIEEQWDFGLVQVTEDSGLTWTSLGNADTRDDIVDEGYPAIREGLPGFTGSVPAWTRETFDLSPWAGKKIHLALNYMTDWGSNGAGWYVDNLSVPELGLSFDGSSLDGFISYQALTGQKVKYQVNFVKEVVHGQKRACGVYSPDPFSLESEGGTILKSMFKVGTNYMITWYAAPEGEKGVAAFEYEILTNKPKTPKKPAPKPALAVFAAKK